MLKDERFCSIIRVIPEEILIQIVKVIKLQILQLTAKKYDFIHEYDPKEFYKFIIENKENEILIYDKKYQNSLNDKNLAQCLRNAFENADEKNEISEKLEEKQVQKSKPIDKDDLMGWDL